ncbi:efflux RND transporter periplasmic adaptor subunit, partial [Dokdonella sp.]|uniref:efflux RND transporter periplasmic adaptor subunit n=1 Tax=Dokdonella sp. TaxID=2291710 RepID=UPI003C51E8FA
PKALSLLEQPDGWPSIDVASAAKPRESWIPAALFAACKGGNDPADEEKQVDASVPVEAVAVSRRSISASYSGTATLEPEGEAEVAAKISGVLLELLVEEGDQVKQGQVLARLDAENPRLNLAKAKAMLKKLENDYQRSSEMFERKLLSVEQNDKIRFDLETQRATYELAQLELSYTNIVAPITGVISRRMVKVGNFIQVNQALFKIENFEPLLAVLNVPERELNTLRADQAVRMRVDSIAGTAFEGKIQRISPVVDSATGTFRVTCEFRDKTRQLKSGMFGRLEVTFAKHDDVLTIPRTALIEEDGETAVFVVVPGSSMAPAKAKDAAKKAAADKPDSDKKELPVPAWVARRQLIKIGYGDNNHVEILSGLEEGERVITLGRSAVRDGTAVQVLEGVQ